MSRSSFFMQFTQILYVLYTDPKSHNLNHNTSTTFRKLRIQSVITIIKKKKLMTTDDVLLSIVVSSIDNTHHHYKRKIIYCNQ